jgi:hypothetical protein
LPDGWAVQTYDVRVVRPDTLGDATPSTVHVRCSDSRTRIYRPHDLVHVVVPVDLS